MGYQLYWVRLCGVAAGGVPEGVRPNAHSPPVPAIPAAAAVVSFTTSGIVPVHAVHLVPLPLPVVALQTGAVAVDVGQTPVPARSAGSCSSRMAFGLIGLLPGVMGAVKPRANPSDSHSLVTACQAPDASLYSTRR